MVGRILALDPETASAKRPCWRTVHALAGLRGGADGPALCLGLPRRDRDRGRCSSRRWRGASGCSAPASIASARRLRLFEVDDPARDLSPGMLGIPEPRPDCPEVEPECGGLGARPRPGVRRAGLSPRPGRGPLRPLAPHAPPRCDDLGPDPRLPVGRRTAGRAARRSPRRRDLAARESLRGSDRNARDQILAISASLRRRNPPQPKGSLSRSPRPPLSGTLGSGRGRWGCRVLLLFGLGGGGRGQGAERERDLLGLGLDLEDPDLDLLARA